MSLTVQGLQCVPVNRSTLLTMRDVWGAVPSGMHTARGGCHNLLDMHIAYVRAARFTGALQYRNGSVEQTATL